MPDQNLYALIPSMTALLQHEAAAALMQEYPSGFAQKCLTCAVDEIRANIAAGWIQRPEDVPSTEDILNRAHRLVEEALANKLVRVINGAGVILHTGLGRAPLAPSAQAALREAAERYCLLATNRDTGKRGDRNRHNEELLRELTGAEAALVVNNNSAAVMLALNTFGEGKEAIVSRGELVEIGGAFRVPDVMRRSRTIMVEVGTTNKTHLRDYQDAVTPETSILLKVHTSNYRIEGFHKEVSIAELAGLAKERELMVLEDIGSGAMIDVRRWGLAYEPTVPEAIKDGADVVTFSGDKMLGGPQSGIIVGRKDLIDRMKTNPLMRAFRCGKLTHAALNGTLRLFLDPDRLPETHPIYAMIAAPKAVVARRAQRIARRLGAAVGSALKVEVIDGLTEMGSGSLPARGIPTRCVALNAEGLDAGRLARTLRLATPALFTRIEDERVLIDARTVADEEMAWIDRSVKGALASLTLK